MKARIRETDVKKYYEKEKEECPTVEVRRRNSEESRGGIRIAIETIQILIRFADTTTPTQLVKIGEGSSAAVFPRRRSHEEAIHVQETGALGDLKAAHASAVLHGSQTTSAVSRARRFFEQFETKHLCGWAEPEAVPCFHPSFVHDCQNVVRQPLICWETAFCVGPCSGGILCSSKVNLCSVVSTKIAAASFRPFRAKAKRSQANRKKRKTLSLLRSRSSGRGMHQSVRGPARAASEPIDNHSGEHSRARRAPPTTPTRPESTSPRRTRWSAYLQRFRFSQPTDSHPIQKKM
jgi:hypothetical protein